MRQRKEKSLNLEKWLGWFFILPGLLVHILAVSIPAVMSLYLPFTEWNG